MDASAARGKGPNAQHREVEQAVENKRDAEGDVGVDTDGELARIGRDSQQIAEPSDYAISYELSAGTLAGWCSQGGNRTKHSVSVHSLVVNTASGLCWRRRLRRML
jgi:hypothetical protein